MDDIARAVGVARRTVFGYYPAKGAIVWAGEREAADAIADALSHVPADVAWRTALVEVLPAALRYPDDDTELLRSRLMVIGRTPELQAHLALEQNAATDAVAAFIASREPAQDDGLVPHVAARAVLAALSAALIWWSTSPEPDLQSVLRRALAALLTPSAP
ncbi:AcrR family transcriptional regulator [Kineococcus radiotolerans]|uniref:AcrR family transcriptional regulator n=2 Tax=Kineococcus radiotolerans TaxID=131568 RepID=A0A7W4XYQ2_KINRA|nr:AcrR family transcriptional regulator [Kineococcus radiotolerans]